MRRLFASAVTALLIAGIVPADAHASAAQMWVKGPGAFAQWYDYLDDGSTIMTTLNVYDQAVSPSHQPTPLVVASQWLFDPDGATVWVNCGATTEGAVDAHWPQSVSASGTLDLYAGRDVGGFAVCDGAFLQTITFSETFTGDGKLINRRYPAYVDKVSPFEHHVYVGSSIRRPATLSVADPFGGALTLGTDDSLFRLFMAGDHETDVCQGASPDPGTGACP